MLFRTEGRVEAVLSDDPDLQVLAVRPISADENTPPRKAINYKALNGTAQVGERVLLNTVAVELDLGTGGYDFVVGIVGRELEDEPPGHLIKLRYTPIQTPVLAVEAPESPFHSLLESFSPLQGTPVVCCGLHSQIGPVCFAVHAVFKERGYGGRVVYIMTDSAALPIAWSHLVRELKQSGLLQTTITCGQAFGGDYEAINLYSALQAARQVASADVILVCQGPGNAGTQTALGFSGVDQGLALNAATALEGRPICVPRISFADKRPRHHGVSQQTLMVLERLVVGSVWLPLSVMPSPMRDIVLTTLQQRGILEKHMVEEVETEALFNAMATYRWTTMGRKPQEDPYFFRTALAAGVVAAQSVCNTR
ncbi:Protein of unknown function (DUF3866) [Chthonomonas calidirosea]|nr:Protein of unknown function (DUF3866) [Chthonomonas calidirosea]